MVAACTAGKDRQCKVASFVGEMFVVRATNILPDENYLLYDIKENPHRHFKKIKTRPEIEVTIQIIIYRYITHMPSPPQ